MDNLKTLQLAELIDRLALSTDQYTNSYSEGVTRAKLEELKALIIELQTEIRLRIPS